MALRSERAAHQRRAVACRAQSGSARGWTGYDQRVGDVQLPSPGSQHDPAYDGVTAAPASHLVVYEDDHRRELVVLVPPGGRGAFHHHLRRSEMRVFRSAPLRYHHVDGRTDDLPKSDATPDRPVVAQLDPEPLHAVENLSERDTYYALRIEFKD